MSLEPIIEAVNNQEIELSIYFPLDLNMLRRTETHLDGIHIPVEAGPLDTGLEGPVILAHLQISKLDLRDEELWAYGTLHKPEDRLIKIKDPSNRWYVENMNWFPLNARRVFDLKQAYDIQIEFLKEEGML